LPRAMDCRHAHALQAQDQATAPFLDDLRVPLSGLLTVLGLVGSQPVGLSEPDHVILTEDLDPGCTVLDAFGHHGLEASGLEPPDEGVDDLQGAIAKLATHVEFERTWCGLLALEGVVGARTLSRLARPKESSSQRHEAVRLAEVLR